MISNDSRLEIFMVLALECNFTRAAARLGISQPAVSQCIAELEKDLGQMLFDRNRRGVTLTEAGRVFLRYAEKISKEYSKLNVALDATSEAPLQLRLWIEPSVDYYYGSLIIENLRVLRPQMQILRLIDASDRADLRILAQKTSNGKTRSMEFSIGIFPSDHPFAPVLQEAIDMALGVF